MSVSILLVHGALGNRLDAVRSRRTHQRQGKGAEVQPARGSFTISRPCGFLTLQIGAKLKAVTAALRQFTQNKYGHVLQRELLRRIGNHCLKRAAADFRSRWEEEKETEGEMGGLQANESSSSYISVLQVQALGSDHNLIATNQRAGTGVIMTENGK